MVRMQRPARASWQPPAAAIDAIATGRHGDPFTVLGPHTDATGTTGIGAFLPDAEQAHVVDANTGEVLAELERLHGQGFFFGLLPGDGPVAYRLRFSRGRSSWVIEDPYRFPSRLGDLDRY